jgi:hypothetical protein
MKIKKTSTKRKIWVHLLQEDSQNTRATEPSLSFFRPVMLPVTSASKDMQHSTVSSHGMAWTILGRKSWQVQENFLFSKSSGLVLGPTQLLVNGHRGSFKRINSLGRAVGHSHHVVSSVRMRTAAPLCRVDGANFWFFNFFKIALKKILI